MTDQVLYQSAILLLLVAGLVPALLFLMQHRPKQWRRLVAWDASGLVIVVALWYIRSIVIIMLRWPGSPPSSVGDAAWAIGMLVLIDVLLLVRLISYRKFVVADNRAQKIIEDTEGRPRP
jgi:hypothetical protein